MSKSNSTPKQLLKSKRVSVSIRFLDDDYAELKDTANRPLAKVVVRHNVYY